MNRIVISILLIAAPFLGMAQNAIQKNGFGINQDFHDYNVRLLDNKITSFDSSLSQSLRISYNRYLGRSWSFSAGITNGFLLNQTEENKLIRKSYLFGGDLDLILTLNNGRFFPLESTVAPYLSFGYNFNYLSAYKDIGITPMVISNEYGFGTYVRLGAKSKLHIGAALNQQLNGDFDTHMQYRLGFAQSIGKSSKPPVKPEEQRDYDNDGIADVDDNCPTLPGISAKGGCPESWAESGENHLLSDSVLAMIESLEQSIQKLKTDLYFLDNNQIVEVKCDPESGDIIGASNKTEKHIEKKNPTENTEKQNPKTDDGSKGNVSQKTAEDDNRDTQKKDPIESATSDKKQPGANNPDAQKTDTQKTDAQKTDVTSPLVKYKTDSEVNAYYVIAISTMDKALAERSAAIISKDYQIVKILPQPNGFYRVGIYATKTKTEALKILNYAKGHGIPSGWIAYE
ncbi:MAG: hypothetical protein ACI8SE_001033 [Bacteroidia bacterium]|jgi:hypothetical protein